MQTEKLQRALLVLGFITSAILLGRFAIDFASDMPLVLVVPFILLVLAALAIAAWNIRQGFQSPKQPPIKRIKRIALLAAIPLGFWASSLDCSGLSWQGCTPFCTFIKIAWIPLLAAVAGVFFFVESGWLLVLINLMSFVTLVPHCLCFNVGNGWWMDRIGASPMCYVWGFVVTLIAVSALKSKTQVWPSILVCGAILAGAFGFFIAHHYFHFPW
jgi:hypothetical protein